MDLETKRDQKFSVVEKSPRGERRMKHYETIFIINPNLGDEEYGEVLSKFRDLIDKSKGVIVKVDEWGKQKLAYRLKKFDSGVYVLVDYCGDPGLTVELDRNLKLDERILKYQTVKLADKADPEALVREELEASEKRPKKAAGVTSSGEVGATAEKERSAVADRSVKADRAVKADEKSAKVGEDSAGAGQGSAEADKPADAIQVQEEKTKEEDSAEADSSAKADESTEADEKSVKTDEGSPEVNESVEADKSAKADESTEADEKSVKIDEGSPEADKSAEVDEVPQEETDVQKEGEKKS